MAARLGVAGENYYDPALMLAGQQALGLSGSKPLMMSTPPFIFLLLLSLALFDYTPARLLWLTAHLLTLVICLDQLWRLYGGARRQRWLSRLICQGHYGPMRILPTTIATAAPDWADILDEEGINLLLLDPDNQPRLLQLLDRADEWRLCYEDEVASLYIRLVDGRPPPACFVN